MIYNKKNITFMAVVCLLVFTTHVAVVKAQNRQLVWADEFNDTTINQSIWSFETGPTYETLHYYTDRSENAKIVNGMLNIIALKESYEGFDYTSALLKTQNKFYWRYGRIEARIKLPQTTGFVPAFWMLPQDDYYGYWPWSGEIDIMEHPTNQDRIFGTCHTWQYSYFTGSLTPAGGSIQVKDSETAFHIYAVEWTPDKIDFFVDDQKYFTFENEHSGFEVWPFDQPFYILFAVGVGGGWVGDPDATTVFPGIMEIDYVRVYQSFEDFAILGPDYVMPDQKSLSYSSLSIDNGQYEWSVPNTSQITSGQNTPQINVDWGFFTGTVELLLTSTEDLRVIKYPVTMCNNLLKNSDFEKGAKYWNKSTSYPADADFTISTQDVCSGERSMYVDAKSSGVNAWEIQLSQTNLELKSGQTYNASFWAKSETNSAITVSVINASNFNLYASQTFQLTNTWTQYNFSFMAQANVIASFNIDMGGHTGQYYFDNFQLTIPYPETNNQVINADFSAGDSAWVFNTFSPATAQDSVIDGEYTVSITNGGVNPWDVYVGQAGFNIEKGKEYTVSFDAYAAAPREIFPLVGKNSDPWTVYDNEDLLLLTNRKTYTFSFIMNETTDTQARFGFDIGTSSEDVFLDNVFLSEGNWPTIVSKQITSPRSFRLYHNRPNPFNPLTTIEFELSEPSFVSLKIYDMNGKLVETLLEEDLIAGVHQLYWNGSENASGVYFCKLTANGMSQIIKMALIK